MPAPSLIQSCFSQEKFSQLKSDHTMYNEITNDIRMIRKELEKKLTMKDELSEDDINQIFAKSEIQTIIKRNTNLNFSFGFINDDNLNVAAITPKFDAKHPFFSGFDDGNFSYDVLKDEKDKFEYNINFEKAWVEGDVSEVEHLLVLTLGFLLKRNHDDDYLLSEPEIAASILHEIGHVFTYWLYLGRSTLLNHSLEALGDVLKNDNTKEKRVKALDSVYSALDIDRGDIENDANIEDEKALITLVVSEFNPPELKYSPTASSIYDVRAFEAISDAFANRFSDPVVGARVDYKLAKYVGAVNTNKADAYIKETLTWVFITSGSTILSVFFPFLSVAFLYIFIINLAGAANQSKVYDDPKERIERQRQNLIELVKKENIPKKQRKHYQEQLDEIEQMLDEINNSPDFMNFLAGILSSVRKAKKREQMVRELQRLANNELFAKANKLALKS